MTAGPVDVYVQFILRRERYQGVQPWWQKWKLIGVLSRVSRLILWKWRVWKRVRTWTRAAWSGIS